MKLSLSKKITIQKTKINDNDVIYVIDNFLSEPEDIVSFACKTAYFNPPGKDGTLYPGIRDLMPRPYEACLQELLNDLFESEVYIHRCMLSLITIPDEELNEFQSLPHVDSLEDCQYASVHYLCDSQYGGTSIYKHIPSGDIKITPKNVQLMQDALSNNKQRGYLTNNNDLFKSVFSIEAKFNRIVIYPSNLLHCADINKSKSISADPKRGRLTVASFFEI